MIVGDGEHSILLGGDRLKQSIKNEHLVWGIEVPGGFICQYQLGTQKKRAANGHPLLFTVGEFGGMMVHAGGYPELYGELAGSFLDFTGQLEG